MGDRPPPLTHGSLVSVFSPDRVRHVGRIVGVSASARVPAEATTIAILVERVREDQLRWDDRRGRAVLANSCGPGGCSITLHFNAGTFWTEDASGRVLNHTTLTKSDGGSGLASGTWANAEGWKWTRAKEAKVQPGASVRKLKPVRETGPRPFNGDDFGGLDGHDGEGA